MPLNDTAIRSAKPKAKPYKMHDFQGLFMLVTPNGGKWWRQKYRFQGKEKLLSLGTYPQILLSEARVRRDHIRKLVAEGIDPSNNRKAKKEAELTKAANSFEVVAREWIASRKDIWSESNTKKVTQRHENDIFPWLGKRPIAEIKAPELLKVMKRIVDRGAVETAQRTLQDCGRIFRFAIATGRAERDVAADLRGALPPVKGGHFAAIIKPDEFGKFLRACDVYEGTFVVKSALCLSAYVFLRPGELRQAEWKEFDLDKAEWNVPARRMKIKNHGDHLVPLSKQAIKILREIQPLTGDGYYVFPNARTSIRPLSDGAVLSAIRRMGYTKNEMTAHGFRATVRTILDEVLHVKEEYIEHQLAHGVKGPLGRSYNRTSHLPERRKMMQKWADYLDKLKEKR
mgnify:CR=1 FL=1